MTRTSENGTEKRRPGPQQNQGRQFGISGSHVIRTVMTNPSSSSVSLSKSAVAATAPMSRHRSPAATESVIAPPPKVVHASSQPSSSPKKPPTPGNNNNAAANSSEVGKDYYLRGSSPEDTIGVTPPAHHPHQHAHQSSYYGPHHIYHYSQPQIQIPFHPIVSSAVADSGGHMAVDVQALRARDERIASLEKELRVMEDEFARELERASAQESETATFWQSKHSAVHQAYLRADTELRLLRAEAEVREAERGELRDAFDAMRREAHEREDLIRNLRGQVRGLKEWVSREATRGDGAGGGGSISDEVFADGMGRLANGLQNWVIVYFRKAKIDLSKIPEPVLQEVTRLTPMYKEVIHTAKVHLLQSIVSAILVEDVFRSYFVGLSKEQELQFRLMETMLGAFAKSLKSPEAINHWRSQTLSLIRRGAEAALSPSSPPAWEGKGTKKMPEILSAEEKRKEKKEDQVLRIQAQTVDLVDRTMEKICSILDALAPITATTTSSTSPRDTALRVLLNNAITLSRLLCSQRARFTVSMPIILPHQKTYFEAESMEDIGAMEDEDEEDEEEISPGGENMGVDGMDEDDESKREASSMGRKGGTRKQRKRRKEVSIVTFPAVVKMGDEHGDGVTRYRNVILKARVLCTID